MCNFIIDQTTGKIASLSINKLLLLSQVGEINEGLQKLIEHFDNIRYSGEIVELPDGFDPASLLPHGNENLLEAYI